MVTQTLHLIAGQGLVLLRLNNQEHRNIARNVGKYLDTHCLLWVVSRGGKTLSLPGK